MQIICIGSFLRAQKTRHGLTVHEVRKHGVRLPLSPFLFLKESKMQEPVEMQGLAEMQEFAEMQGLAEMQEFAEMQKPPAKRASRWDIAKRWTPILVEDGFTPVPLTFLTHYGAMGITSAEAMLIIHLMSHKWDEKNPFPTFGRIATRMRISETAVRGHARSLEKKKLLKRITRPGRSNQFDLKPLFERLEKVHITSRI